MLWESAVGATADMEMKARIHGVSSQILTFKFLFGFLLAEKILRHTDKLSTTLQQPEMSAVEAHRTAMLSVQTQKNMRNEAHFDLTPIGNADD